MITTVAKFCSDRNVSRQFVYEYVRKGKFKIFEIETYTRINDNFVVVGKTKVLEVPNDYLLMIYALLF